MVFNSNKFLINYKAKALYVQNFVIRTEENELKFRNILFVSYYRPKVF